MNHWVVGIITIADRFFATEMKKMSGLGELTANDLVLKTKQVFEDIPPNFEMEISLYRWVYIVSYSMSHILSVNSCFLVSRP